MSRLISVRIRFGFVLIVFAFATSSSLVGCNDYSSTVVSPPEGHVSRRDEIQKQTADTTGVVAERQKKLQSRRRGGAK